MRSRRNERTVAEAVEPGSAPSEEESVAPSSPTVLSITKTEGPVVRSVDDGTGVVKKSKIPTPIQFPLVVILSLAVSSIGYSVTYPYTKAAIAVHARSLDTWQEYAALMGWRM